MKIPFLTSKIFIFLKKNLFFLVLEKYYFKIPKNSIASAFFFAEADTKNIDIPR